MDTKNSNITDKFVRNGLLPKSSVHGTQMDVNVTLAIEEEEEKKEEDVSVKLPKGRCGNAVGYAERKILDFFETYKQQIGTGFKCFFFLVYMAFYIFCMMQRFGDEGSIILTVITIFIVIKIATGWLGQWTGKCNCVQKLNIVTGSPKSKRLSGIVRRVLYVVAVVGLILFLALDVLPQSTGNVHALIGIVCLIFCCFLASASPSHVNWHPVFWGFIMQFIIAVITLRTEIGYRIFKWMGDVVYQFVRLSDKGSNFVLGASFRATAPGFFFETAGIIVFFNACIFVLDFFGILELVILTIGKSLAFFLQTGPIESVVAAANIFIGLSEAPLLVRPYLPVITKSELHAIMTCGFASISGAFMAMFINAGAPPTHLLTACLISAPAALAISKLMFPETEIVNFNKQKDIRMHDESSPRTVVQAISDGATFSIKLVATIMVNMMAFVSLLNLIDVIIVWIGNRAGTELTFNILSSYVLYPVSWLMGIPSQDCMKSGYIIGLKTMATPFVAYKDLGAFIQNRADLLNYVEHFNNTWHHSGDDIILEATNRTLSGGVLQAKTEVILTYAMCGISAFPSIGFSMGTLIPMSPARKQDVVSLVLRAFAAGNLANLATGAVAGVMYKD